MTYGGLTNTVAAGGKIFLPVGYKNLSSAGMSWSSTLVFWTPDANATVNVQYIDNRAGFAPVTSANYTIQKGTQFDLRNHASTAGMSTFFGAMVINVVSGNVAAMVQTRGLGGTGDALMAYQGLSR